jgi:hypothetical protein
MSSRNQTSNGFDINQKTLLNLCLDLLGVAQDDRDEILLKTYLLAKANLLCITKKITPQIVLEVCASTCIVTEDEVKSNKPRGDAHTAKLIYYRLASRYTLSNQETIGNTVNVKRTAYVLGLQKANDQYENDKRFYITYNLCETQLLNQIQQAT